MSDVFHRPLVSETLIVQLARTIFNLEVVAKGGAEELESYEDRNFMVCGAIKSEKGQEYVDYDSKVAKRYVVKVMNARESYSEGCNINAIDDAMIHISRKLGSSYDVPLPQKTISGELKEFVELPVEVNKVPHGLLEKLEALAPKQSKSTEKQNVQLIDNPSEVDTVQVKYYVRLLSYVEGEPLSSLDVVTDDHMFDCGKLAARVSEALKDFSHPALLARNSAWDIENFSKLSDERYLSRVDDIKFRIRLQQFFEKFEEEVVPMREKIPKQAIHSDIAEKNTIVSHRHGEQEVSGLIDFGDLMYSYRVCEIANCMSHIGALRKNEINDCRIILSGYLSETELAEEETNVLFYFVTARTVLCYLRGLYELRQECNMPNDYVRKITSDAKESLEKFLTKLDDQRDLVRFWTTKR